jgi:hypothetical protein
MTWLDLGQELVGGVLGSQEEPQCSMNERAWRLLASVWGSFLRPRRNCVVFDEEQDQYKSISSSLGTHSGIDMAPMELPATSIY